MAERLAFCAALLLLATSGAAGQQPVLRVNGADVQGIASSAGALYPAPALEALGFRLAGSPALVTAVSGADTLRFWDTSPFFRHGGRTYQLAAAARVVDERLHLPEQLFIQWLPTAFPDQFEYRGGAVHLRPGARAPVAAAPPPQTPAQSQRTQSQRAQEQRAQEQRAQEQRAQEQRAQEQPLPRPRTDAQRAAARARVIVIDPGHGGRDPGKIGPNGLREKDVTLLIAQRLGAVLRERGYEVHLTRTTDTLISLADRPKLANRWKGDRPVALFLSIHANSATASSARGFETFFLAEARTDDERRVAEMENEAVRFEERPSGPTPAGLDQVVNDLRSDFLMRASYDLAAILQERMAVFHPGPNRGVKRAGFYVLVGSIMPAVLVETAFLSNREEAALLGTQAFQQKLAWGIADGVDEFFRRNEHLWAQ